MESSQAVVQGRPVEALPVDLYIPPEALRVFLEVFEGPLDFLSYLIRKQNLDILSIDVAKITQQYSAYVEMMKSIHFELAADYLAMAAWLTELKSRFLLPGPQIDGEDTAQDPRAELLQRVLEYEQIRQAAESIDRLPRLERDIFLSSILIESDTNTKQVEAEVSTEELLLALTHALKRASLFGHHRIHIEPLSMRERMTTILDQIKQLNQGEYLRFNSLWNKQEGAAGVIISLLAVLELLSKACIELAQNTVFGEIYIKAIEHVH